LKKDGVGEGVVLIQVCLSSQVYSDKKNNGKKRYNKWNLNCWSPS
jgi:hypothetical protein